MPRYGDLEHVEKFVSDMINRSEIGYAGVQILSELYVMPTADVAPVVHAKEIPSMKYGTIDPLVQTECSNCGCGHRKGIIYNGGFKHCPNCGAKMDERRSDEQP